jgi:hypothetical protein
VREAEGDELYEVYREAGGELITYAAATTRRRVNAILIAAAPDLLAAARLANQELIDLGQGSSGSPALAALWAAIAKAEGRE